MKKLGFIIIALLVAASLAGCGGEDREPVESAWEITIGDKVVAIEDIREMETVTIEAEKKDETHSYTGVRLSVLLTEAGITDFESLTLEAEDGYSYIVSREEALSDNSILAYMVDGEDLKEEKSTPVMFVSSVTSSQAWVGKLKNIRVNQ